MQDSKEMIEALGQLSRRAGDAILAIYGSDDFAVETKSDDSPLTAADLASHRIIVDELTRQYPEIPLLSEESTDISWTTRAKWDRYFLIDPLDGTKEFINRNGEFTVNIALIEAGVPVLGVVYVPVKNVLYAGYYAGAGASSNIAFVDRDGQRTPIQTRPVGLGTISEPLIVVASRRHGGEALEDCMRVLETRFETIDTRNMGSSLKLCLVAEGAADLYPRLAPTSEWDTAAAHAVVLAAGGRVVDAAFESLAYNTKEDILNPFFYVIGDAEYPWQAVLEEVGAT